MKHLQAIIDSSPDCDSQPLEQTEILLIDPPAYSPISDDQTPPDPSPSTSPIDDALRAISPKTNMDDSMSISTLTFNVSESSFTQSNSTPTSILESIDMPTFEFSASSDQKDSLNLVETNRQPPCYRTNRYLHDLLDLMSDNFIQSECEGYVFGSTNYKKIELPHDFDIILENIRSSHDRLNVDALIQRFKDQGGEVTARDERGIDGYRTGNRHVIPMTWKQWKLDFILSAGTVVDHSKQMDFTVGALYFNLRQKKMYRVAPFTTLFDLDRKRLCTITDPMVSFAKDPSQIFRAVRLMAAEGFHLSTDCDDAIRALFADDNNPFNSMKVGKFFQQLQLLFNSGYERENVAIMYHLGLFFKLFDRVQELGRQGGYRYVSRLEPYYYRYVYPLQPQPVYFVPHIMQGCFFVPHTQQMPVQPDEQYPYCSGPNGIPKK